MGNFLTPGNVLFIKQYKFENGGTPKDKLFIVLAIDKENSFILRALTTSVQKVPDNKIYHGCTNNGIFSFYLFEKDRCVGADKNGENWAFSEFTYIHVKDNILKIPTSSLAQYGNDVKHQCCLHNAEYTRLMKCIKNSKLISRGLKRDFERLL